MMTNNLTIIIPIRIDSDIRLSNLTAVINYYKRLKLPLLLIEADKRPQVDFAKLYKLVRHIFISDSNPIFHRTKYINVGLRNITTPHAAIIDADVIVPPEQLKQANLLLNQTPMTLPYDGRFINMPHSLGDIFRNTASFKDIQTHYESNKMDYMFGYHSVGGAYLVNVDLYRQCGWENEYFTGWGPEDFERVQRMDILGYPVKRIRGVIYHLDHPRGINSGNSPYSLAFSTRKEYCKICSMAANELRAYIHSWPWVLM
ncbi:MAG: hypothetical protein K2M05_00865 [Paramuribaculum sp.]|nr:hypothetical protein [Paramuribaculum sp.]MDE6304718.1 hypothetical protein [Paramuribaculum sp.]